MAILPKQGSCAEIEFDAEIYIDCVGFLIADFLNDFNIARMTLKDFETITEILATDIKLKNANKMMEMTPKEIEIFNKKTLDN